MKPTQTCPKCHRPFEPNPDGECFYCARTVELPLSRSTSNHKPQHLDLLSDGTVTWHESEDAAAYPPAEVDMARLTALLSPAEKLGEIGRLGGYRILDVMGVGGMGVIFHGEDAVLQRRAPIKAMLPSVAVDPVNRKRFLREARAAAGITHDHIVTIYHVAEDGDLLYMAMEFLEGETLASLLQRVERLSLQDVLRISRETAFGLAAAHEHHLIHRDIKPANLWLQAGTKRVKILDFGLVRASEDDAEITKAGMILGTPAYMAPEQARGLPIDARCDLYSLGTVMYRLTTGRLPFPGLDTVSTLTALVTDEPPFITDIVEDMPYDLAKLVSRMLAKDPADRPSSAREVLADIANIEMLYSDSRVCSTISDTETISDVQIDIESTGLQPDHLPVVQDIEEIDELDDLEFMEDDPLSSQLSIGEFDQLRGRRIAHYRLNHMIAKGHHGCVFHGVDELTQQEIALKVFGREFPKNDRETRQFAQAMRDALAVKHPHIVGVRNAGRSDPYCWIAMEYMEGESLTRYIERLDRSRRTDWRFALRVAIHVSRALYAVTKDRQHVHRNVTAANILVQKCDQIVKLNDLYLLRAIGRSSLYANVLDAKTFAEMIYLAPEQAAGEASFVDFLCDMYSLGVVVYILLTGHPPFVAESLEEALPLIREEIPTRPRKRQKGIPPAFDAVVMRMLEKRQEDRFQNFSQLLVELNSIAKALDVPV